MMLRDVLRLSGEAVMFSSELDAQPSELSVFVAPGNYGLEADGSVIYRSKLTRFSFGLERQAVTTARINGGAGYAELADGKRIQVFPSEEELAVFVYEARKEGETSDVTVVEWHKPWRELEPSTEELAKRGEWYE